jgi:hypothetical protein
MRTSFLVHFILRHLIAQMSRRMLYLSPSFFLFLVSNENNIRTSLSFTLVKILRMNVFSKFHSVFLQEWIINLRIPGRHINISRSLVDTLKIIQFYGSNSARRKECSLENLFASVYCFKQQHIARQLPSLDSICLFITQYNQHLTLLILNWTKLNTFSIFFEFSYK